MSQSTSTPLAQASQSTSQVPGQVENNDNEDALFASGAVKIRFPELLTLFNIRTSPSSDGRTRDAQCRACTAVIPKFKIERLVTHVTRTCTKFENLDKGTVSSLVAAKAKWDTDHRNKIDKSINARYTDELQRKIDLMIVDFISVSSLPLAIVKSGEFKSLLSMINPNYKLPGPKKMSNVILPERAEKCFNEAMTYMKSCDDRSITVEFDGWSSANGLSLMAVTLTAQTGHSFLLELVDISSIQHTATNLAELAITAIHKSNIPLVKFNVIVTDEASNFKLARQIIVDDFDDVHLLEYRCFAHVLNLIGGSISKSPGIKEPLEKLVKLVTIINRQKKLVRHLKDNEATKLVQTVPTRWYSTCASINSALKMKEQLQQVPHLEKYGYSKWGEIVSDDDFWSDLGALKIYFDRLSQMIGKSEACASSLSVAFADLLDFGRFLIEELDEANKFREIVIEAFLVHFQRLDLCLLLVAYVLNPSFKLKYLTVAAIERAKLYMIQLLIEMNYGEDGAKAMIKTELQNYFNLTAIERQVPDVYSWWRDSNFPHLKILGMRFSAMHASSANTERIFSALGTMITASRNRLALSTISDLLAIKIFKLSHQKIISHKERTKEIAEAQTMEEVEGLISNKDLEESETVAPTLDEGILNESYELIGSYDIFCSSEYDFFKNLIDYSLDRFNNSNTSVNSRASRIASANLAKEIMNQLNNSG